MKQLISAHKCSKCLEIKPDTAFPIHIGFFSRRILGIYHKCSNCASERILKRMDKFINNKIKKGNN